MTATSPPPGVTVATVLRDLADSRALDSSCWRAPTASAATSPFRTRRRPAWRCRGSTPTCAAAASWCSARARSAISRRRTPPTRTAVLRRVLSHDLPCLLITDGFAPPPELLVEADRAHVPLLRTRAATPEAMSRMSAVLDTYLAARGIIHGVLMDILGLGVLVIGESGIGKSECALDLVVRGHRLVADDAVEIRSRAQSFVLGSCPELTRHHMEIRGLGLINVQDLFGVASTRTSKRVELVVQLERWEHGREYDRLGLDDELLRTARHAHPDDPHAGRAGTQRRHPRGSRGPEPAAPCAWPSRRAPADRALEPAAREPGDARRTRARIRGGSRDESGHPNGRGGSYDRVQEARSSLANPWPWRVGMRSAAGDRR